MAWVYILRGSGGRYYIGSTTDLEQRQAEHRRGHTHTTTRLGEIELVASVEKHTLAEARDLERTLERRRNPSLHLIRPFQLPPER
jgi:predicted GIY-YIG superfamily endonuclease